LPSSTRRPYRLAHPGSISSARLECSKTTLYSLASTTEHLVLVVRRPFFRDAAAEIEQAVQAEPDPRQRIRVYLAGGGTAMRRHAHAFYDDMVGYEPTAQIYRKNSAAAAHRVHQLIEEGVQACVFRALNGHFAAQVVAVTIDAVQSGGLLESTGLTAGTPSPSSATSCWTGSVRGKAHPGLLPQLSARPGIRSRRPGKARRKGCISRIVSARDHPVSWWMVCVHSRNSAVGHRGWAWGAPGRRRTWTARRRSVRRPGTCRPAAGSARRRRWSFGRGPRVYRRFVGEVRLKPCSQAMSWGYPGEAHTASLSRYSAITSSRSRAGGRCVRSSTTSRPPMRKK
jgi:AcrR family transcriptional regulator